MLKFTTVLACLKVTTCSHYAIEIAGMGNVTPSMPVNLRLMRSYGLGVGNDEVDFNVSGPVLYPLSFKYGNGTLWHKACPHMGSLPQFYPNIKTAPVNWDGFMVQDQAPNFYDFYEDPATGENSCNAFTAPFNVTGQIVLLSANHYLACERENADSCMFDTYERAGAIALILYWNLDAEMGVGISCKGFDGNKVHNMPILFTNIWEEEVFGRGNFGDGCDGELPPFAGDARTGTPGLVEGLENVMVDVNMNSLVYLAFGTNTGLAPCSPYGCKVVLHIKNDGYRWTGNLCQGKYGFWLWQRIPGILNVVLMFYSLYLIISRKFYNVVGLVIVFQGIIAPCFAAVRNLFGPLFICKNSLSLQGILFFSTGDSVCANVATTTSLLLWGKMVLITRPPPWADKAILCISCLFLLLYIPMLDDTVAGRVTGDFITVTMYFTFIATGAFFLVSCVALQKIVKAAKTGSTSIKNLIRSFRWIAVQIVFLCLTMVWQIGFILPKRLNQQLKEPWQMWAGWGFFYDPCALVVAFAQVMFFATSTPSSSSSSSSPPAPVDEVRQQGQTLLVQL